MKRSASANISYLSENKKQRVSTSTAEVQDNILDQEEHKTLSDTVPQSLTKEKSSPIKSTNVRIGTSNFSQLVAHNSFVDKTLLIKDFVTSGDTATLITCPRRFGKSTNMNMIKTFLEIEVNSNGERIPEQDRQNYKLFTTPNLLISQHTQFVTEHLGQYPVIFVSFKNVVGTEYQEIFNEVRFAISSAFCQHKYMLNVLNNKCKLEDSRTYLETIETKDSLEKFLKIFKSNGQNANKEEIENSLNFLSELLCNHFKKKVYVLIDEYDRPLDSIMRNSKEKDLVDINLFIDLLLGTVLKDNDTYLEKGLMTGISVIAKNSSSSKLNNVSVYRFLDDHVYGKYYGFNNEEIINLVNTDTLYEVTRYYNGYLIIKQKLQIYNPWSIMKYIQTGNIINYWCQSGPIEYIQNLFKYPTVREKFNLLIKDNSISFQFNNTPKIQDIQKLQKVLNYTIKEMPESYINLFFSYIFEHGYLTPVEITAQSQLPVGNNYKIPNQEIIQEFARNAMDYYIDFYRFKQDNIDLTVERLNDIVNQYDNLNLSQLINDFASAIQMLCRDLEFTKISSCEDGSHPNESLLHTIVGWIIIQSNGKKFGSEVPINSGMQSGKADIVAIYKDLGIIIELKYNKTAGKALEQIEEKNYNAIFLMLKCTKILNIGINLDENKQVTIEYNKLHNNNNVTADYTQSTLFKSNDDNLSGNSINNKYDYSTLLYHESWNKYYLNGMKKILELRIKDLPVSTREKVIILTDLEYQLTQDSTGVNGILNNLLLLNPKTNTIVLLPYNIYNKHWVGLIITKDHNDSYQIKYLDSEVKSMPAQLIEDLKLVSNNLDIQINISQGNVEQQKYNNCGPEVVENFIQVLTGSRLPQEQVVLYHSKLVENDLLTNLYLDDVSIEVLGSNIVQQFQI